MTVKGEALKAASTRGYNLDMGTEVVPKQTWRQTWREILSTSTAAHDLATKLPVYAEAGVPEVWLIDSQAKTVEVLKLQGNKYFVEATLVAGAERSSAMGHDKLALDMPTTRRRFAPGQLQFLTSSTYRGWRRAQLCDGA